MASEALKQAMADLAASGQAPELSSQSLAPSKLGTKQHWDEVYEREVKMFKDIGDEGEVWSVNLFLPAVRVSRTLTRVNPRQTGSAKTRLRIWLNGPRSTSLRPKVGYWTVSSTNSHASTRQLRPRLRVLCTFWAVGTGNGQLMFAFSSAGYTSLTGIDYSPLSIQLARSILETRLSSSTSATSDNDLNEDQEADAHAQPKLSQPPPNFFQADILEVALDRSVAGVTGEHWDLVTDKGTYDAVCLSDETKEGKRLQDLYVDSISRLLQKGGIFLITSCESFLPYGNGLFLT